MDGPQAPMRPRLLHGKFANLLFCLIALPLLESLSLMLPSLEFLYWMLFLLLLFVGLLSVDESDRSRFDETLILLPSIVALASVPFVGIMPEQHFEAWITFRHAAGLIALGVLIFRILRNLLRVRCVVFDQICGGLCVYILFGYAFAFLYSAIERLVPGSFIIDRARFGLEDPELYLHHLRSLMTYFSFITLTTLGFGDITPAHDLPRSLVATQAVIGQIYLAVFVARLVSLNLTAPSMPPAADPQPRPTAIPTPHRIPLRNRG